MRKSKLKYLLVGLGLVVLYSGVAAADLWALSENPDWSGFERLRIKTHLEAITTTTLFVPPIGPLRAVHHGGRLLDAYIDQDKAPSYTMNFLRALVLEAADCRKKVSSHEKRHLSGRAARLGTIKCEVPFGYGFQDTFQVLVYSERIDKEAKTAFFVNGLGLVPSNEDQSPMHLLRKVKQPLKDILQPAVMKLDSLFTQLENQKMARPLWINLTDAEDTSRYSDQAHRMRQAEWKKKIRERNRAGEGMSAEMLFAPYR